MYDAEVNKHIVNCLLMYAERSVDCTFASKLLQLLRQWLKVIHSHYCLVSNAISTVDEFMCSHACTIIIKVFNKINKSIHNLQFTIHNPMHR